MSWSRLAVGFIFIVQIGFCQENPGDELRKLFKPELQPFYHGVASGDPLQSSVIIWTRVTPETKLPGVDVSWEISDTRSFRKVLKKGNVFTSPEKDYTVKVDVTQLKPGQTYYYRFKALKKYSPIGQTKTLPSSADSLSLAVVSCSNWEFGYFSAYSKIAEREVDAVLHLGDYIYEYATGKYGNKNFERKNLPAHEIVTLDDYRIRYAQYHLDDGLRAIRQRHPMITIWDDHEIANDAYATGAQNHQPDSEGEYEKRKSAAKQAYYEWIPIRESDKHYRKFSFGDLADLFMLDERLEGRTRQLDSARHPAMNEASRSMLGAEQLAWFKKNLRDSKSTWKIVGNQVIFSDIDYSAVSPKRPRSLDSWDGYPAEKREIAAFLRDNKVQNLIFLAGDTHSSWAFEITVATVTTSEVKSLGAEFGTPSITSANSNESTPDSLVLKREKNIQKANPHIKYINHRDHGYMILTISRGQARAEWYFVDTLMKPESGERLDKRLRVKTNSVFIEAE